MPSDVAPATLGNWSPDCRQMISLSEGEKRNDCSKIEMTTSGFYFKLDAHTHTHTNFQLTELKLAKFEADESVKSMAEWAGLN